MIISAVYYFSNFQKPIIELEILIIRLYIRWGIYVLNTVAIISLGPPACRKARSRGIKKLLYQKQ